MDVSADIETRLDRIELRLESHEGALKRIGDESLSHGAIIKQLSAVIQDMQAVCKVRQARSEWDKETLTTILVELRKQQQSDTTIMLRLEKLEQDWRKSLIITLGTIVVAAISAAAAVVGKV